MQSISSEGGENDNETLLRYKQLDQIEEVELIKAVYLMNHSPLVSP